MGLWSLVGDGSDGHGKGGAVALGKCCSGTWSGLARFCGVVRCRSGILFRKLQIRCVAVLKGTGSL